MYKLLFACFFALKLYANEPVKEPELVDNSLLKYHRIVNKAELSKKISAQTTEDLTNIINSALYGIDIDGKSYIVSSADDFIKKHFELFCAPDTLIEQELAKIHKCPNTNPKVLQHADQKFPANNLSLSPAQSKLALFWVQNLASLNETERTAHILLLDNYKKNPKNKNISRDLYTSYRKQLGLSLAYQAFIEDILYKTQFNGLSIAEVEAKNNSLYDDEAWQTSLKTASHAELSQENLRLLALMNKNMQRQNQELAKNNLLLANIIINNSQSAQEAVKHE